MPNLFYYMHHVRYDMYGSEKDGYCFYDQERDYIKGSRSQFVHREVYQMFAASRYSIDQLQPHLLSVNVRSFP